MTTAADMVVSDQEYNAYLRRIQERFDARTADAPQLYSTDARNLFDLFLAFLPSEYRQEYTCGTCRSFVEKYGNLVTIDDTGKTHSVLWNAHDAPPLFQPSIRAMVSGISQANVDGVFYNGIFNWGTPDSGRWTHFSVRLLMPMVYSNMMLTAGQASAAKRHDHETLERALADFDSETLKTAVSLLRTEALYRSERVLGVAEWLLDLQKMRKRTHGKQRDALMWRAVATAPTGYCHPRSSMIGTLLTDIADGMSYKAVSERFAAKMHPLQYMRPQTAPGAQNVALAEKIIARLSAAGALRRRYAKLEELQTLWKAAPDHENVTGSGVFATVQPRQRKTAESFAPPQTITWEKFQRMVLPTAQAIDLYLTTGNSYVGMLTAADPNAPRIFQWDNPLSWYVYVNGSDPERWNLTKGTYGRITAITHKPSMWADPERNAHLTHGVIFVIEGARDSTHTGLSLFPEFLRSEFRSVRKTIEAFSKQGQTEGVDEPSACGLLLSKGSEWDALVRVTDGEGSVADYRIDRWD